MQTWCRSRISRRESVSGFSGAAAGPGVFTAGRRGRALYTAAGRFSARVRAAVTSAGTGPPA